jgi:xeroderma pigmentosum group C-complementing protein
LAAHAHCCFSSSVIVQVGFEFRQRRCVPIINGVIVPAEFKDVLMEAYYEDEARRAHIERDKMQLEVLNRWVRLVKGLLIRERIKVHFEEENGEEEEEEEEEDEGSESDV